MAFKFSNKQQHKQPPFYSLWDVPNSSLRDVPNSSLRDVPNSSLIKGVPNSSLKEVPRYPSGYDDEDGTIHIEHHHVPEAHHHHQRAHFVDFVELSDNNRVRKPKEEKKGGGVFRSVDDAADGFIEARRGFPDEVHRGGIITSVDDDADGFIKAKHRAFEFRQWTTFKK